MSKKLIIINIISGLFLSLAFPKWDYYPLAWILIVPLIYSMLKKPAHSFIYGIIYGLASNYLIFYWIIDVIVNYSNIPLILAMLINLLLSAYLSLFWAIWAYTGSIFFNKIGCNSIWILPFTFILLEYIRSYFLTGFPWCLLGYSQYKFLSICQIASIMGIYGISFLVILINCTLTAILIKRFHQKSTFYSIIISCTKSWSKEHLMRRTL